MVSIGGGDGEKFSASKEVFADPDSEEALSPGHGLEILTC
jgi:hypothetical protein